MKRHIANSAAIALLCAAVTVVTAGCSADRTGAGAPRTGSATGTKHPFDGMTPEQIHRRARAAVERTTSMRLKGDVREDGRRVTVDLAMDHHRSCNGTVGNSLGTMHIVKKGSRVHVKAGEAYWRATFSRGMTAEQTEKMVAAFKGRWIKPPKVMAERLGRVCSGFDVLIAGLRTASGGHPTREEDATVGGRPAAVLAERTTTETTTLYIAKEGRPYFLRGTVTGGDQPLDLTFSEYDEPVDTTPPPPDQILDPTTLRRP